MAALTATPVPTRAPRNYPFGLGGVASAMAALFTHPLDLSKVRMQLAIVPEKSTRGLMKRIVAADGVLGLYDGLSAALLRSMSYSVLRFGAYEKLKKQLHTGNAPFNFTSSVVAASAAGAFAGMVCNPVEVVVVRMTSDRARDPSQRWNYRGPFNAMLRIARTEGVGALYKGLAPNTLRAVLMNTSQLTSYDLIKSTLTAQNVMSEGIPLHVVASIGAGTIATTACSPADVLKARLMAAGKTASLVGVVKNAIRTEGLPYFFRGWVAAWTRLCPQTVLTLVFLERLRVIVDWSSSNR